jgi:hypothetical protein
MNGDLVRMRQRLKEGDFRALFIEELGWDRHDTHLTVHVGGQSWALQACAQKRGMVTYLCPAPDGVRLPDYAVRRKIEHQVARSVHEHLIVFLDATKATQVWQWVRRESGKPIACREHHFHREQTGEALAQKLQAIAFTLVEEEGLTLTDVTRRTRSGFDVERITKRFYDQFKKEHAAFLKFITGITESADHEWYASVMLNRLMFVYFIQRKGFLDGDADYLRNRLDHCRRQQGKDKFYSFYRYFLLRLFHEGLGGKTRTAELEHLLGRIPYLNGGLFEPHQIEKDYADIQIPDEAFEHIFNYFDQYQWHLDERPLRADNEINPDVLGYIFEKYINQKQMGAYYTKEDITEYISKNTVLPFLFDAARAKCKVAFENPQGPTVWDLLAAEPDRYLYPAVRKGADQPFPAEIAVGIDPPTLHQPVGEGPVQTLELRKGWNKPAPAEFALPTETWREVVARRQRYKEVRSKLAAGEVCDINNLITLNLDIRQFAQDAIENCKGPELLRAFWHAIEQVTILDPTCGSGAFLFAALNILEPLYEACLERMEAFVEDLDRSGEKHHPEKFSDFREVLKRVEAHPNRCYFIFKSIILNNLFGVDIMEEAVEICKLRLFLKLAAQVEPDTQYGNLGIEPLPDIDFNIRAGNTLVGFVSLEEIRQAAEREVFGQGRLLFGETETAMQWIEEEAEIVKRSFRKFHQMQEEYGMDAQEFAIQKQELRRCLNALTAQLDGYLAREYGIDPPKRQKFEKWSKSHQPFHWFVEFYGIMSGGGFDVIIGNPPYVEYSKVKKDYQIRPCKTESCGNLYAFILERNALLVRKRGRTGMIVPHSAICTDRMAPVQELLTGTSVTTWTSTYCIRPAKLFVGVDQRLAICISLHDTSQVETLASRYHRWHEEFRPHLFALTQYANTGSTHFPNSVPKVHSVCELALWAKIVTFNPLTKAFVACSGNTLYFHNAPRYWVRAMYFTPYFWNERDGEQLSTQVKTIHLPTQTDVAIVVAALNSSLFYWWFLILSDCRHLNMREIERFPIGLERMADTVKSRLAELTRDLMSDFKRHKKRKRCEYKATGKVVYDEFYPKYSKLILDEIDTVLARHYGFTEEDIDFIINYDVKYRIGRDVEGEDE